MIDDLRLMISSVGFVVERGSFLDLAVFGGPVTASSEERC
jgi:hypothetical protein